MQDIHTRLRQIKRPSLLIKAAQMGNTGYRRAAHLQRLLGEVPASHTAALLPLIELEQTHNDKRKSRDPSYSITDHLRALIALQAEAALHKAALEAENSPLQPLHPPA